MKNNKPALILAGAIAALFVISLVIRFVALSELGMPGGWTLYFGLPVGGIGLLILLLRLLGLLNFGQGSTATIRPLQHGGVVHAPWTPAPTVAPTTQRLQEIENRCARAAPSPTTSTPRSVRGSSPACRTSRGSTDLRQLRHHLVAEAFHEAGRIRCALASRRC